MNTHHGCIRFFTVLALSLAAALVIPIVTLNAGRPDSASGWRDDFSRGSIDHKLWVVASGGNPGSIADNNQSNAVPSNVTVSGGYLVIRLDQTMGTVGTNPNGVISDGGAIYTKALYGYGTYEWRMRMSTASPTPTGADTSNITGSVSAGFNYVNNSQTEIDFEYAANAPGTLYMTNWYNTDPSTGPFDTQRTYDVASVPDITAAFHTYTYVWKPGEVDYYVDGFLQAAHTTNVPSAPASVIMNHWGTNSNNFGGLATLNVTRYLYVDYVQFTPLP